MLHSPFSCLAAAHRSITMCYYIELCKLNTGQAYRSGWRMQGHFTYPKSQRPTSSSLVTRVPLPVGSLHTSCARHHVQKLKASIRSTAKQTHTQTSPCQESDNVFFFSLPWLPDPLGSVSMKLFIFLIFNTANPAWSLLNYFQTCRESSAGHSSKVWALGRERRQGWIVLNSNRVLQGALWAWIYEACCTPAWPTQLVCPIMSPQTKQSQDLWLNWPDKAFCSVVATSATQTS